MVLDALKNMSLYEGLSENFKQVAEYVKKTDLRSLEAGKYVLENGDFQMFTGEGSLMHVAKDHFTIFFPEDGHMPCVGTTPCAVRKIVVKVPVEQ